MYYKYFLLVCGLPFLNIVSFKEQKKKKKRKERDGQGEGLGKVKKGGLQEARGSPPGFLPLPSAN